MHLQTIMSTENAAASSKAAAHRYTLSTPPLQRACVLYSPGPLKGPARRARHGRSCFLYPMIVPHPRPAVKGECEAFFTASLRRILALFGGLTSYVYCLIPYQLHDLNEMNGLNDFSGRRKSFKSCKSCTLYDAKQKSVAVLEAPGILEHRARQSGRIQDWSGGMLNPLALSRFLRRGMAPACKNRSAAPLTARLFLPQAAPRRSCPEKALCNSSHALLHAFSASRLERLLLLGPGGRAQRVLSSCA